MFWKALPCIQTPCSCDLPSVFFVFLGHERRIDIVRGRSNRPLRSTPKSRA